MSEKITLVWFRNDLRLDDHPALAEAASRGAVVPVYIHDPASEGKWRHGAASNWWLNHSLAKLSEKFKSLESRLILRNGDSSGELKKLISETGAGAVFWNRRYEPEGVTRDKLIKEELKKSGIDAQSFGGNLLNEPWTVQSGAGTPYKVFTPYWKQCFARPVSEPLPAPSKLSSPAKSARSCTLRDLNLLPKMNWYEGLETNWKPGESGAKLALESFLGEGSAGYLEMRDIPSVSGTSRLSPHLHFGEISSRRIVQAVQKKSAKTKSSGWIRQAEGFIRQIYWREFAYYLLYHFPQTTDHPLRKEFENFQWQKEKKDLKMWQSGLTGFPIVDAGMRELWHTGWMHGRVRMIAASFLVKDLLIPWQEGARWFWDTLVDADLANNTLGWQWTAGCGADAAPYFRIFNPVTQSKKFDPEGNYIRRWIPEIAGLNNEFIHCPWLASKEKLEHLSIKLGQTYPMPMVDHSAARKRALLLYHRIKQ